MKQMDHLDFLSLLFIAIGLSADCFAVSLSGSISMKSLSRFQILRASFSFGLFQAIMPLLGWLAGRTIVNLISNFDHWVAFALLGFIGGKMLWGAFHSEEEKKKKNDFTKRLLLLTLSIATSIDALAVGLSFAFLDVNIGIASLVIGVTAFLVSIIGLLLGKRVGKLVGKRAETIGGLILIAIGLRILLTHLL
jgi:manganese efflux pump family protein